MEKHEENDAQDLHTFGMIPDESLTVASHKDFEGNGIRIIYCKENVVVHPSKDDAIMGDIFLIEEPIEVEGGSAYFLAWTPYYLKQELEESGKSSDPSSSYAVKVPVKEISSIRKHIPTIGIPSLTIISKSGIAFPPYYFADGGIREFFSALKVCVPHSRSDKDPNLVLLNESADPMTQLRSSLDKKEQKTPFAQQDPMWTQPSTVENLSWSILEQFSKVTQLARTPSQFLHHHAHSRSLLGLTATRMPTSEEKQHDEYYQQAHSTSLGTFELLEGEEEKPLPKIERTGELSPEDWMNFLDEDGKITNEEELRKRVFYGGIDPSIRLEVWKYLSNFYPFDSTYQERKEIARKKSEKYNQWKNLWNFVLEEEDCHFSKLKQRMHAIEKDVFRTDRTIPFYAGDGNPNLKSLQDILVTYTMFNFDLGYVQGMNEILSPILYVMQDEAEAFWCFKGIMDKMESNFHKDQNGMHTQLVQLSQLVKTMDSGLYDYLEEHDCLNMFFCFRWIIIHFKREFSFNTIQRLWEVLWSNHYPNFHLFLALALLLKHREEIIKQRMEFDDILQFINGLSQKIVLDKLLVDAERIYQHFQRIADPGTKISFGGKEDEKPKEDSNS